jgi:peptide/nickel transport system substrate-binding protein
MRRKIWVRLGTALLVTCLIGSWYLPAPAEAAKKRILNFAAKEPETLDPHTSVLGQVQASVRFLYRGLTRFAIKDGKVITTEVEPDLAESWTTSDEGTVWTFKLRKGVQFHKGFGEMTAEDVKFSFERQIKRTKGMLFAQNLEVIQEITVVDPYTVQITLKAYDPVFLLRMVGYQHGGDVSEVLVCYALGVYETQSNPQANRVIA